MYQVDPYIDINKNRTIVLRDQKGGKSVVRINNVERRSVHIIRAEECIRDHHSVDGTPVPTCCDFIVAVEGLCYFVELKGEGLVKAIKQIASAAQLFSTILGCKSVAPVVSGTKIRSPAIAGAQKEFEKMRGSLPELTLVPLQKSSSGVSIDI